jgi:GT2 family glycosyltransferase
MTSDAAVGVSRISVCVATRNRGARITPLLESLKRLDHGSFEVVIVDQSTDDATRQAYLATAGDDQRFSYTVSNTVGKSVACNIAVARACGVILAFTDDDCVARSDWLEGIERAFAEHPEVGGICGGVVAAEYDPGQGHIPVFMPTRARVYRSRWSFHRMPPSVMGANIALRAEALRDVAGFDEAISPGATFRTGDDYDIVYRLLRAKHGVLLLPGAAIVHYGFRAHGSEMRTLTRDCAVAHGAICMKHLRLGDPAILPTLCVRVLLDTIRWSNVIRFRGPTGLSRLTSFAKGMARGSRYPLQRATRTYAPGGHARGRRRPSPARPSDGSAA